MYVPLGIITAGFVYVPRLNFFLFLILIYLHECQRQIQIIIACLHIHTSQKEIRNEKERKAYNEQSMDRMMDGWMDRVLVELVVCTCQSRLVKPIVDTLVHVTLHL